MTVFSTQGILVTLLAGIVAGWLAGKVVRGGGFGLIGDLVVGILGAFIAAWLFPKFGFHVGGGIGEEIVWAMLGAIILLLLLRLVRRA